ncbi:MAG: tetratricopeptide repeat protein [Lachnospiraceae bacterium]|nr:tetratricopeptide repeat protein [Lachnospiraceae bacterium]
MECYNCGCPLSELDYCTNCGADVKRYKRIMYTANRLYNEGLDRAGVRDLSGAIRALRDALRCNKNHVDARNLLGLVYYETGEAVAALAEWVISKNIRGEKNPADEYIDMIQSDKGRLDTIKTTLKKFNVALMHCRQGSYDLAVLQLKKVLSLNPKFTKARRLLGLLYMQQGDWNRAKKELAYCSRLDIGDVDCLRYLQECDEQLHAGEDEKSGRKKKRRKEAPSSVSWNNGNEIIIQPVSSREPLGLHVFLQIGLGILIGVCVTFFILVPVREAKVRSEEKEKISSYGEQIDAKNGEINDLNARIRELEQKLNAQTGLLEEYNGSDGILTANDNLHAAAYAYLSGDQNQMLVEQYLSLIPEEYVANNASAEYLELFDFLQGAIGGSVAGSYYESGKEAYRQKDFAVAIADFEKAYHYDQTNDDALYYLGLSYYESGDSDHAAERFRELLNVFPESELAEKARQRLEEIGE